MRLLSEGAHIRAAFVVRPLLPTKGKATLRGGERSVFFFVVRATGKK
jgi:hypothetical protein